MNIFRSILVWGIFFEFIEKKKSIKKKGGKTSKLEYENWAVIVISREDH